MAVTFVQTGFLRFTLEGSRKVLHKGWAKGCGGWTSFGLASSNAHLFTCKFKQHALAVEGRVSCYVGVSPERGSPEGGFSMILFAKIFMYKSD